MPKYEAQVLGGFVFNQDGGDVKGLYAERLMLFLSYLFVHYNSAPTRKQISFLFWADSTEKQARTNLRNILHHLRKALPELDSILEVDTQFIRLRLDADLSLDIRSFKTALAAAKTSKTDAERIGYLQEAVSHYRGELLPGFYDDWILASREECHQAYVNALFELSKLYEDARQYTDAIQTVNRLLRVDVLNESAYLQLMRLYALNDDRAGALQVYHHCVTVFKRELDLEPSAEIKSLHQQLIQSKEAGGDNVPEGRRLIGRKQEWAQLRSAWQSASKGKPMFIVILGEAGIGKTRLAKELMQWTSRQGIRNASAQCYLAEGNLPFAPVIAWLRAEAIREELKDLELLWKKELARLIPEHDIETESRGETWQRQRLFEALAKGLLGSRSPRLLILDDAQWCDNETLELVHYLLRYDTNAPLMILATVRIEALDESNPLNPLRLALQSKGKSIEMELAPLDKTDVASLARDLTGNELDEEKIDSLYAETEGNPFFVVEMLRGGSLLEGTNLPQSLRSVLSQRVNQLSASARDLVGFAAAIGREFNFRLLSLVSPLDEMSMVQALDELWTRRIIQTQGADTYNFTHGKLLDAAYETLSAARRLLVHRKIAQVLIDERQSGLDVESAILAHHLERGGQFHEAADHYLGAAREARRVFANREAISHLERALNILAEKVKVKAETQARLAREARELLGDLYDMASHGRRAIELYAESLTQSAQSDPLAQARMLGKLGKVMANEGDYDNGKGLFNRANEILGECPKENDREWKRTWLRVQLDRVWMEYDWGNVEGIQSALETIQPVIESGGKFELDKLGEYYFLWPTLYFRRDGYQMTDEIMHYSTLALETSRKAGNMELSTRANFGYGFCNFLLGNFETAIQHLEEGLRFADQIGYVEQQAYNLTYLSAAHRCAKNLNECKTYAERMLALSEQEDGYDSFAATAHANLGWIAWKKGDLKQARVLNQKALLMWGPYYPFCWYGLWTMIAISLSTLKVDEAVEYARRLKAPGQQVFAKEGDELLAQAIEAADKGDKAKGESLLMKAVDWAKKNHYL